MTWERRVGYRDEGLFGDGITSPIDVAVHETQVLGNVDIAWGLLNMHANKLTPAEREVVLRVYDYPSQGYDATEEDIAVLGSALKRVLDGRDFCKWLCSTPSDIVLAYMSPYPDEQARIEESECSAYIIPADAIALTDTNDPDGTLWAWRGDWANTDPVETVPMAVALQCEGWTNPSRGR